MPTVNLHYFVIFYAVLFDLEFCFGLSIRIRRPLLIPNAKKEREFLVVTTNHGIHLVFRKLDVSLVTLKCFRPQNYRHMIFYNRSWFVLRQKRRKWIWDPQLGTSRAYRKDRLKLVT